MRAKQYNQTKFFLQVLQSKTLRFLQDRNTIHFVSLLCSYLVFGNCIIAKLLHQNAIYFRCARRLPLRSRLPDGNVRYRHDDLSSSQSAFRDNRDMQFHRKSKYTARGKRRQCQKCDLQ